MSGAKETWCHREEAQDNWVYNLRGFCKLERPEKNHAFLSSQEIEWGPQREQGQPEQSPESWFALVLASPWGFLSNTDCQVGIGVFYFNFFFKKKV